MWFVWHLICWLFSGITLPSYREAGYHFWNHSGKTGIKSDASLDWMIKSLVWMVWINQYYASLPLHQMCPNFSFLRVLRNLSENDIWVILVVLRYSRQYFTNICDGKWMCTRTEEEVWHTIGHQRHRHFLMFVFVPVQDLSEYHLRWWVSRTGGYWLLNVTCNDISVIYVTAQMCRRTEEEVVPKVGHPTP